MGYNKGRSKKKKKKSTMECKTRYIVVTYRTCREEKKTKIKTDQTEK